MKQIIIFETCLTTQTEAFHGPAAIPRLLLLLSALLVLGGFLATLALSHLAAMPTAPSIAACGTDCAPRPWLDPGKARRFAEVFRQ